MASQAENALGRKIGGFADEAGASVRNERCIAVALAKTLRPIQFNRKKL